MVSALDSRSSSPCSSPDWGHCVVFLCRTLYSHSVPLHPGVKMGTGKFHAGVTLRWTSIPSGGRNTPNFFMLQKPDWPYTHLGLWPEDRNPRQALA